MSKSKRKIKRQRKKSSKSSKSPRNLYPTLETPTIYSDFEIETV